MPSSNEIATGSVGSTSKCCWPFSGVVPPHSPLPEVSDRCTRTLDRCASTRIASDALPARGLHTPQPLGSPGSAEQESPLRSLVPYQCGNSSRSGTQSETSRRGNWLLQRVAYLEPKTQNSSACSLCRSCRRPLA